MHFEEINLFPVPVTAIRNQYSLSVCEKAFLVNLPSKRNAGNSRSTDSYVLESEQLSGLKTWIDRAVQEYFQRIFTPISSVKVKIIQSWVNFSAENQYHHAHSHKNSFISGVFYIQSSEGDVIHFLREARDAFHIPSRSNNEFNSDYWWVPAEQGTLLLFPSWLQHRVPAVKTKQQRISMSFNTYPFGVLGDEQTLTELII